MSAPPGWWGPWFPLNWFGPWFPDGTPDATLIPGVGPPGVATLVLDLTNGAQVTYSWATDVRTMYSGKQFRAQPLDDPKQLYTGIAILGGNDSRVMRARLAKYAAIGAAFLLALPYEAITLSGPASGTVVPVDTTAHSDWMVLGQRIAVTDQAGNAINAVIQDFTSDTVTLDVDPGELGRYGCMLMPCVPVYLDPQQGFQRYTGANGVEGFQIKATAATFGYASGPRAAFALLTASAALTDAVISAATTDAAGNALTITLVADNASPMPPQINLTNVGDAYTVHYNDTTGVVTVADLIALVAGIFTFSGSFDPTAVLAAGDAIGPVALSRGADKSYGTMGISAALTTYDGRPVWDRGVETENTATDSIQSLSELVDLGGIPIAIGTADASDWGRQVSIDAGDAIDDWQWLKLFLSTVRGRQIAFWLPTSRPDLIAVDVSTGTVTIEIDGTFDSWWPMQRDRIRTLEADGTITYTQITGAVDNGDGTMALTVAVAPATVPTMVSWLDLCVFDTDDFQLTWTSATFALNVNARAVQQ